MQNITKQSRDYHVIVIPGAEMVGLPETTEPAELTLPYIQGKYALSTHN